MIKCTYFVASRGFCESHSSSNCVKTAWWWGGKSCHTQHQQVLTMARNLPVRLVCPWNFRLQNLLKNGFCVSIGGHKHPASFGIRKNTRNVKTETYPSWTGPIALPRDSSVIRALVIDSVVLFMPPSCCFYHTRNQKFVSVNDKQRKSKERKMKIKKWLHETRRRALGLIGGWWKWRWFVVGLWLIN